MNTEILGTDFKYIIDVSHGINRDGFIAIGTESVVYKGIKTSRKAELEFACVLKFKPKYVYSNGEYIDKISKFKDEELSIFEELQECRSVVRIFDVIEDLGDFSLPCDKVADGIINREKYFCVIEEYIDGWSLEEYCRSEYWKLRKYKELSNGLKKVIEFHDFTEDEKINARATYYKSYDNILLYQNEVIYFMKNLSEILEFVTEEKKILHLDIKPENIMVTKHGKELVLIDFGRSKRIYDNSDKVLAPMPEVCYGDGETIEHMYQYGTLGYAAPECYAPESEGSKFPFSKNFIHGEMSIESDIFSFGATFWECLNIFDLVTKNNEFSHDAHDFYEKYFLSDNAYCNRDLTLASVHYHKKAEDIIKKCTRLREHGYTDKSDKRYYHSYKELRKDIIDASNSIPTIVRAENVKVKSAFGAVGKILSVFTTLLIIVAIYRVSGFKIANDKWDLLVENYQSTQFAKLENIASDMIKTASASKFDETYRKISGFVYSDGDIDEQEAAMLINLLSEKDSGDISPEYVDEIMKYANSRKFKEISKEIMKLDVSGSSTGYQLAQAIYNAEIKKENFDKAYETLCSYQNNSEFRNAVVKLKNVLDNDETIQYIIDSTGSTKDEIKELFNQIGNFS